MKDIFEVIRRSVNFQSVAESYGIIFKNKKANCPFHNDKNASFHNYNDHGYCFGCEKTCDVIELEYELGNHSNRFIAAKELCKKHSLETLCDINDFSEINILNNYSDISKILEKYVEYTNRCLLKNPKILTKIYESKALTSKDVTKYKIGYSLGNFVQNCDLKQDEINILISIGILKELEYGLVERFNQRLIFPILNYGRVVNIWSRDYPLNKKSKIKWLGLPNSELIPHKEIPFVENLSKKRCLIVESIPDAITILKMGFPCIALIGTSISDHFKEKFLNNKTKLIFALDPDEAGIRATKKLIKEYKGYSLNLNIDKDFDEYLAELIYESGSEISGLEKFKKILIKAIEEAPYYLDTIIEDIKPNDTTIIEKILIDIRSLDGGIAKEVYLQKLKDKSKIGISTLRKELNKREDKTGEVERKSINSEEYSDEEIKEANKLINENNILDKVLDISSKIGYIGEDNNKKLLYLAFTSRVLDKSISIIVKGKSAAGKSSLVENILQLFPTDDIKDFSYITPKALVYSENDLSHKILYIKEHQGGQNSDYSIRTIISEGEISIMVPVKDPTTGSFETKEKRIKATGMVFIQTTTKDRINAENQTRVFDLFLDESEDQTKKILKETARNASKENKNYESKLKIFRCAQKLLKKYEVIIPFAEELVDAFPVNNLRVRRDFQRVISLIKANALLNQLKRNKKDEFSIYANLDDLEAVIPLLKSVFNYSFKELTPKQFSILETIYFDKSIPDKFKVQDIDINKKVNITYRTIRRYIKLFIKEGYLSWNGESGTKSLYLKQNHFEKSDLLSIKSDLSQNLLELLDNLRKEYGQKSMSQDDPINLSSSEEDKLGQTTLSLLNANDLDMLGDKSSTIGKWVKE